VFASCHISGSIKIYFCEKMVVRVVLIEFRGFKMQHFQGQNNNLVKLSKSLIRLDKDPATPCLSKLITAL